MNKNIIYIFLILLNLKQIKIQYKQLNTMVVFQNLLKILSKTRLGNNHQFYIYNLFLFNVFITPLISAKPFILPITE